jgi:hypothetical protein
VVSHVRSSPTKYSDQDGDVVAAAIRGKPVGLPVVDQGSRAITEPLQDDETRMNWSTHGEHPHRRGR